MSSCAPAAEKQRLENLFVQRMCGELGGAARVEEAYRAWLRISAKPGLLEVSELTEKVRWESAMDKAAWRTLAESSAAGDTSFFVMHLTQAQVHQR